MSDDIVTRLRGECQCSDDCRAVGDPCIPMRAADEIERLRAENKRLSMKADIVHNVAIIPYGSAADEIERLRADVKRWSNWAIDYACDDITCECDRCTAVRAAWEETQHGR